MSKPNWTLEFLRLVFPRNPKQGKLTRLPGVARWVEKRFFEGDHLLTLPKDAVISINQDVEEPGQMVLPSQLADHFIDRMDFHWIMDFCICRRSMPCKDFPVEFGCLFMGEAARGINPEWGRRVTPGEAKDHLRKCQDAGLIHFIGKSKLDTVWLGIGPGEKLLTICSCCPCCCITRGLKYTDQRLRDKLKRAPGVRVWVTGDCIGCGRCAEEGVCFSDAIRMDGNRATINEDCRGCGRCLEVCPNRAIQIGIDTDLFMEEGVRQISDIVDVPPPRWYRLSEKDFGKAAGSEARRRTPVRRTRPSD